MTFAARFALLVAVLSLAFALVGSGCNRESKEVAQLRAETVLSLGQLEPKLADLEVALKGLRRAVEDVATRAPGGAELRAKYYNADEVVGVLNARMKWLSSELEAAKRSPKREQVVKLREAVVHTFGDLGQVSNVLADLMHESARLARVAALLKAPYERELSTGYLIKAATDGVESHLIDCIEGSGKEPADETWFAFDRLLFTGNGADLDVAGSRSQLENVAQILRAYPAVKLRIAAYEDGEKAPKHKHKHKHKIDRQLCAERAREVTKALVQSGIDPDRLETVGAIRRSLPCRARSEACVTRNDRVAVLVRSK